VASVFFSYSHADEVFRDQLEKQLSLLKRQGVIEVWHDRRIGAGQEFAHEIDRHVETDDIFLLLISADFLASDYCYDKEMTRAMQRHEAGEAIVIPVILRACDWQGAPFGKLNASPPDGKPVTKYPDRDEALLEVAKAVRAAAERVAARSKGSPNPTAVSRPTMASPAKATGPRSSNLRITKEFSERHREQFRNDSFEYMAKFFENSLNELTARNPNIETTFRKIDANRFTAAVYKNGKSVSRCTVFIGDRFISGGIAYLAGETTESNSYNECLTIEADEQALYLRGIGMARGDSRKLSQEGAAEFYWSILIERLQSK
jgi:TIR domain-containing protein